MSQADPRSQAQLGYNIVYNPKAKYGVSPTDLATGFTVRTARQLGGTSGPQSTIAKGASTAAGGDTRFEETAPPSPIDIGGKEGSDIASAAMSEEEKRAALRRGRRSTILTSPFGIQTPALTRRRTLLGE